jgi:hypothetical protein
MEGNCFSEKQRVFVILPKEHLWWISADRHAFGGFRYSISAEGTPMADFFQGNAHGGFRGNIPR